MKKINFRHSKYVIPIIALPFIFLFYYLGSSLPANKKNIDTAKADSAGLHKGEINPNMPGVSKEIASQELKNKFEAYADQFKNDKDYSAINEIQDSSVINKLKSNYSDADIQKLSGNRKLDSLQKVLRMGQASLDKSIKNFGKGSGRPESYDYSNAQSPDQFLEKIKRLQAENARQNNPSASKSETYNDEMKAFRDQMSYVDSMTKAASSANEAGAKSNKKAPESIDPNKDPNFIPVHVSGTASKATNGFNTLSDIHNDPDNIKASIDQEGKVQIGTRIRIKLLQDMFIGDKQLLAGSYIYGIVSGFQVSRINISITQIMLDKTPVPVKLDIYDTDGYLGLYVPRSNFREFSKEIGTTGTQGLSSITTSDNSNITTGLATKLFQTTTTSAAKLMAKDKAYLKYNYNVFLKERKQNNNSNTTEKSSK
jgi:conjugative transposon TraM protein